MGRKIFPVILVVALLFSGCVNREVQPAVRVVTQVDVACRRQGEALQRSYVHRQKIQKVLNYLRLLELRGPTNSDPEAIGGNAYEITVHFSWGAPTVYYQRCERFLSKNRHPWQKIYSQNAGELYSIVEDMPTDV